MVSLVVEQAAIAAPTVPGPIVASRLPNEALPIGACDCHAHLFGPQTQYPYQVNRSYTPPDASEVSYRTLLRRLGFQRAVLVQPSVYGTDNSLMLDTLAHLPQDDDIEWRGVAVVDASVSDAELERMHRLGVRGVRINLVFPGGITFDDVRSLSNRLQGLGWHIQFLVDVSCFEHLVDRLSALPTPSVIDHMGHVSTANGTQAPGFQALLQLLENDKTWVKLTGPNRISTLQTVPFTDVDPFFQALVDKRADRCVFGTDWPHVQLPTPMPRDEDLVNELLRLLPDAALRQKILTDNPAQLYGF